MNIYSAATAGLAAVRRRACFTVRELSLRNAIGLSLLLIALVLAGRTAQAQINVLTAHNDIARTGQNLNETILEPSNLSTHTFGRIFYQKVSGSLEAQPLYVSQLKIPNQGVHNVVYVATAIGYVYAFDADSNGGVNALPLWHVYLPGMIPGGTNIGTSIFGTPVIDLATDTMYLVCAALESGARVFRLHALDIATGAEKFGAPVQIEGSVAGTGNGSVSGSLAFDPAVQVQRPGLLELNGIVYVAFGAEGDVGAWHGWIFSFNAATLQQIDLYCTSPNGAGGGLWMSGAGLAAEVNNPALPYGRMFYVSGNGTFAATAPYTNAMSYGMSIVDLDLAGGVMSAEDDFSPYNEAHIDAQDGDLGSGGAVLLPTQKLSSGATLEPLVQLGKYGAIGIFNRNSLGGFHAAGDEIVQEVQTPLSGKNNWGTGVWGSPAYWNDRIYIAGSIAGGSHSMVAYSFLGGQLSTTPTSETAAAFPYPAPTPSISANGATHGIVWVVNTGGYSTGSPAILQAYNATNLANLLYSSDTDPARDSLGPAVKFVAPTIANGKVYVGSSEVLSIYGMLDAPVAPPPVFSPNDGSFRGSQKVSITDSLAGAQIFYTTDGSTPTVASQLYTGPITLKGSATVTAIASATGSIQSAAAAATFTDISNAVDPSFSLGAGSYAGTQTLTITDSSPGAAIYYTFDGSTPSASSSLYTQPLVIPVSETMRAMATAPGLLQSGTTTAAYTIAPAYNFAFPNGFAEAAGQVQFNGSTGLDDFRLQLTNGLPSEAGSAFYREPVNIEAFTTDFVFQLSNPDGEGMTFTIQNNGPTALGSPGGALGYATIPKSVAIKFDIYNNDGEGVNSTGIFAHGIMPTLPSVSLAGSAIDLHSGDTMAAHITYDGINLSLTLTDQLTGGTWSNSFAVDIPALMGGGVTGYVGFTGGTGAGATASASQKVTYWTYLAGQPSVPSYPVHFDAANLSLRGLPTTGSVLQLTDGGLAEVRAAYYATPVNVTAFTTDFDFQLLKAIGDGFVFVLQNAGDRALGGRSAGGLGYAGMTTSVAIKFDIANNAGEGTDSTGVYLNGASPTVPSIDLTSSGVLLDSGDILHAHIVYDGTTLTWTLSDNTAPGSPSATNAVTIDIPDLVGANTAYAGFTAASSQLSAIQDILNWTYSSP